MNPQQENAEGHIVDVTYERMARLGTIHHASHTEQVVSLLLAGEIQMELKTRFIIKPGMVTLIPAGMPHHLLGGKDIEIWRMAFCSNCLTLDENNPLMSPFYEIRNGRFPTFAFSNSRRNYFIRLLKELDNCTKQVEQHTFDVIRSLVILLLNEIKNASPIAQHAVKKNDLVSRSLQFIQKNALTPISLHDVAAGVHRNPAYITTLIKKETGYSVGEWIAQVRLAEACTRLLHTRDSIESIALQVGWNDVTHFIRQFKKHYGNSPAAWRREKIAVGINH